MSRTIICTRSEDCNFQVGSISDLLAHFEVHNRVHNYFICKNKPCWDCIKREEYYDKFNKHGRVLKTGVIIG